MGVKRLITAFEHIKKRTFSEKEPVRSLINNRAVYFVNTENLRKWIYFVFTESWNYYPGR